MVTARVCGQCQLAPSTGVLTVLPSDSLCGSFAFWTKVCRYPVDVRIGATPCEGILLPVFSRRWTAALRCADSGRPCLSLQPPGPHCAPGGLSGLGVPVAGAACHLRSGCSARAVDTWAQRVPVNESMKPPNRSSKELYWFRAQNPRRLRRHQQPGPAQRPAAALLSLPGGRAGR